MPWPLFFNTSWALCRFPKNPLSCAFVLMNDSLVWPSIAVSLITEIVESGSLLSLKILFTVRPAELNAACHSLEVGSLQQP